MWWSCSSDVHGPWMTPDNWPPTPGWRHLPLLLCPNKGSVEGNHWRKWALLPTTASLIFILGLVDLEWNPSSYIEAWLSPSVCNAVVLEGWQGELLPLIPVFVKSPWQWCTTSSTNPLPASSKHSALVRVVRWSSCWSLDWNPERSVAGWVSRHSFAGWGGNLGGLLPAGRGTLPVYQHVVQV